MKRSIKKLAALALVACLLCGLCGCNAIDEMRQNQAFYQSDGTVVWQGSTYKLLAVSDLLSPEWDAENVIFLTEPDVPVLLSSVVFESVLYASEDGRFLRGYDEKAYCREDCFDEIQARLFEAFKPEVYCYFYRALNPQTGEYEDAMYELTAEQVEAVGLVRSTVEPSVVLAYSSYDNYSVDLFACSADLLLKRCNMEIAVKKTGYDLLVHRPNDVQVFSVPEGLNDTFADILEAYNNKDGKERPMDPEAFA